MERSLQIKYWILASILVGFTSLFSQQKNVKYFQDLNDALKQADKVLALDLSGQDIHFTRSNSGIQKSRILKTI